MPCLHRLPVPVFQVNRRDLVSAGHFHSIYVQPVFKQIRIRLPVLRNRSDLLVPVPVNCYY